MPFSISIPKEKYQAEDVITRMLDEGKSKRAPHAIDWWTARWYLRGVRNFNNLNYQNGTVQVSYMNDKGVLEFKYEDIVSKYQAQLGRLLQLNLSPVVSKEGISLDGMRKSSIGQVVLDSVFPKPKIDKVQREASSNLLRYGTVALIPWVIDEDSIGIEVSPPWELIPIPIEVDSQEKMRGLIRRKPVPLDWIKSLPVTPESRAEIYEQMQTVEVPVGYIPAESKDRFQGSVMIGTGDMTANTTMMETKAGGSKRQVGAAKDKTRIKLVEAAEVWTMTDDNYWDEYILWAGGKIVYRTNYKGQKRQFPPQLIVDIDVGNIWGRSFVNTLIPLNCEVEAALARLFHNVKEWDLYGIIYEPTTAGISARILRGQDGLKRVRYEPDPIAPDHKPYSLNEGKTGLLPAKIVELGAAVQKAIANQPTELLGGGAPGRVDSASGLGFLFETSNVPLTPTAKAISEAFSHCYRVVLDITRVMWGKDKLLEITHLDDSIAGVTVNQQSGKIELAENSIPHPDEVIVSVASAIPRSREQRKMELKEALKDATMTPTEYRIAVRKEGLDIPVGAEVEWQNYRRATLENIILFGDGINPGEVTLQADTDMHPIHLMKLDEFMAKPEFYLASPMVRKKFVAHRQEHLASMGVLPDNMPYAEEAAEEALGMMDAQQQMAGMGGGGMPQGMPMM